MLVSLKKAKGRGIMRLEKVCCPWIPARLLKQGRLKYLASFVKKMVVSEVVD